jgi:hypothetical protein
MKPTKANLECADVILNRNHLLPSRWPDLRRDIALAIDIAETGPRKVKRSCKKDQQATERGMDITIGHYS